MKEPIERWEITVEACTRVRIKKAYAASCSEVNQRIIDSAKSATPEVGG